MKTLKIALLIVLVYFFQVTIASRLAVFGVKADLFLIIITLFAVTYGPESGFSIGLVCGLVQDVFGGPFYIHAVSKALLGFLMGTFKESVFGTEEGVALTAVLVATVTNFVLEAVMLFFFFGRPLASPLTLLATLILSCLYNSLLAPLFYPLVKHASRLAME
jgi:rod shape-determining protein MreD